MTSSYQHSRPGRQLDVDIASADENDPLYSGRVNRPEVWKNKRVLAATTLGVALMAIVTLVAHVTHTTTPAFLIEGDATYPPDYTNKKGQYNWQKCMVRLFVEIVDHLLWSSHHCSHHPSPYTTRSIGIC